MKPTNKLYLDWSRYLNLIDQLYNKINWRKEKFNTIISISRGGNVPGTILSHKANVPLTVLNKGGMIYETGKYLVVDDISHTGGTLSNIDYLSQGRNVNYFKKDATWELAIDYSNKNFKIATIHYRKESKVVPDYFVEMVDRWIVYPYEKD